MPGCQTARVDDERLVIAVYGTLRSGQRNPGLLEDSVFLGTGLISGALHDVPRTPYRSYAYPAHVEEPRGPVLVELYRLPGEAALERIDRLERYDPADEAGSQYVRRVVGVTDGPVERAGVYFYRGAPGQLGERIADGDWVAYVEEALRR